MTSRLRIYFGALGMCWAITCVILVTHLVIMAHLSGGIVSIDINRYGEGIYEALLVSVIWIPFLYYLINRR